MSDPNPTRANTALLFSVFCIAVCGLIYELLAGTVSSYLLGDSVYQFSLVIGLFVSSMGLGSYLTRFFDQRLPDLFVFVEILLGLVGGFSAGLLFFAFSVLESYAPFLFLLTVSIGALIGFEIPLVIRILKQVMTLKVTVSNVFTLDYLGALVASLLFPLVLVPKLGLMRTSLFFGLLNLGVGCLGLFVFREMIRHRRSLFLFALLGGAVLLTGFLWSSRMTSFLEDRLYHDEIIYSKETPHQRIVITRNGDDVRMFSNGSIQFSSLDEYRYHEALVHPAMALAGRRENVLILGGGDGLALREVLKYDDVTSVVLVDIDKVVTELFQSKEMLVGLNGGSLRDPRVKVVNQDGWKYLEETREIFDVVIIDLPDPDTFNLSKLYSQSFYRLLSRHLSATAVFATQATSPLFAREAFWCIFHTIQSVESPFERGEKLQVIPYHTYIPSFGEWGFVAASPMPLRWQDMRVSVPTRFLTNQTLMVITDFPPDIGILETEINTINRHPLVSYYEKGWSSWE